MFLFCTESEVSRQAFIRGTETPDARQTRLDADRSAQQVRRSTETPDARQARLDANTSVRRSTETPGARHARLDADRSAQQVRRSTETPDARQARLQQDRRRHSQQRDVTSDVPLFKQPAVHSNFHSKLASLEFHNCNICFERFPNLVISTL